MGFSLARGFSADLHLAARRLVAMPLFTVFAMLFLALGRSRWSSPAGVPAIFRRGGRPPWIRPSR